MGLKLPFGLLHRYNRWHMDEIKEFFTSMNAWEIVGGIMAVVMIWIVVKILIWIF